MEPATIRPRSATGTTLDLEDSESLRNARDLYLNLIRDTLTGTLSEDSDVIPGINTSCSKGLARPAAHRIAAALRRAGIEVVLKRPYDPTKREGGLDWPARAESMIGIKRMDNIRFCIETAIREGVPGDLIETGVWRGGAVIYMRAVLKAYGDTTRRVFAADSFQGLPPAKPNQHPADAGDVHYREDALRIGVEQVRDNFRRYGLLDDQVRFLVGWFKDTLPKAPIDRLAVLRLDGDMYGSTMDAISALYPKLSPGGFCVVDDYLTHAACRQAISDYREANAITDTIVSIDTAGVFWRKQS
ncbi:TylF/MycF family methyltransferase [Plantactinospora sp. B5E13]|uniref:TylF/MycF family methyltransferase n=1 Tax=Plantactinospora sp. B5E13 TaxID=3153758 RepID=UPI00325E9243